MVSASTLRLWNSIGPAQSQMFGNRGAYNVPAMQLLLGNNTTGIAHIQALTGRASLTKGQLVFSTRDITLDERMRIDEFGNIGIGTIAPSTTLHVSGTLRISNGGEACDANRAGAIRYTSSSVFQFCMGSGWQNLADAAGGGQADRITSGTTSVIATQDRSVTISTSGTQRVVIGENGKVGVGTASPSSTLHVLGSLALAHPAGTASANSAIQSFQGFAFVGWYGADQAAKLETNSNKDVHLKTTGGVLVIKGTNGNVGIATTTPTATLQVSGSFIVSTSAQTTTPSLYVGTTSGFVGVGTSSPLAPLHVAGGTGGNVAAVVDNNKWYAGRSVGGTPVRLLGLANSGDIYLGAVDSNTGKVIFRSNGGDRVAIDNAGNVGIGTTAPSATLTVSGSAIVSGTVQVAGTGNEACTPGTLGTIRFNPVTGAPQICVQR